ncbi:MAG: DUF501 domain-containing protein [Gaiellales bacterium]
MIDVADLARLERQLGRAPIPPVRVACRCASGWPVVVEQPERTPAGEPFPTAFWLSCPGLVQAVSRLEGAGGVRALERRLAAEPELAASFDAAMERHRALRPAYGLGIGGVRNPRAVKCLHAHVAFALACPPHPAGAAVLAEAGGIPSTCCMEGA